MSFSLTESEVNFRVERGIKGPKAVEVEVVDPWFGRNVFLDLKIDDKIYMCSLKIHWRELIASSHKSHQLIFWYSYKNRLFFLGGACFSSVYRVFDL